ncbi:PilZ domain-containing protein [Methylophaga frappieri]|uniref:PilZ domain-containing protein n=1 Tax=Methylophaga frappieri (strain ATCC BAA-2434 / DSM 25690 / JAM7) TaxID=754477 RepID=I1YKF9_METFJ|nr:PilZ domain-containing protein [Methylophaga frappieri]AFJ03402.1 PilZ domain-containing protein [Methylophaga frappieri]
MAQSSSREQNKLFLEQLERQRLQKPCLRHIDLRGRVPGECQAYQMGDRVHYLDDRSYVLLKSLLEQNHNQFTIGVYERWQKALKRLLEQDNGAQQTARSVAIAQPANNINLVSFDHLISRQEPRLNLTTSVLIDTGEVQYHAGTLNISATAIRISMRRAHQISAGQSLWLSLPALQESAPEGLLTDIACRLLKVSHDARYTQAVILLNPDKNKVLENWLTDWISQQHAENLLDLDNDLSNLASEYLLRLYCQSLPQLLLWCPDAASRPIFIHAQPEMKTLANDLFTLLSEQKSTFETWNASQSFIMVLTPSGELQIRDLQHHDDLSSWLSSLTVEDKLFWVQQQPTTFDTDTVQQAFLPLQELQPETTSQLVAQLSQCQHLFQITQLDGLIALIKRRSSSHAAQKLLEKSQTMPEPQPLVLHLERHEERYQIRTPVRLHLPDHVGEYVSEEVSIAGVSLQIPSHINLTIGSRVNLDFVRWQGQTKLKLTNLPYEVRNQSQWQGQTRLGLKRITSSCTTAVNTFFIDVMRKNRPTLRLCHADKFLHTTSRLFADTLRQHLHDTLLYFGLDSQNNRLLQSVASSEINQAAEKMPLWSAINDHAGRLTAEIKLPLTEQQQSWNALIVVFRNAGQGWQIQTDPPLASPAGKVLLRRAIAAEEQYVFHCHLAPVKSGTWSKSTDLQQQLTALRQHNSHKVKQLRETLSRLFAVAHLTDITCLIDDLAQ